MTDKTMAEIKGQKDEQLSTKHYTEDMGTNPGASEG